MTITVVEPPDLSKSVLKSQNMLAGEVLRWEGNDRPIVYAMELMMSEMLKELRRNDDAMTAYKYHGLRIRLTLEPNITPKERSK